MNLSVNMVKIHLSCPYEYDYSRKLPPWRMERLKRTGEPMNENRLVQLVAGIILFMMWAIACTVIAPY